MSGLLFMTIYTVQYHVRVDSFYLEGVCALVLEDVELEVDSVAVELLALLAVSCMNSC